MDTPSSLQEATPTQSLSTKPLVVAAYKYGEPYRKRRVKVHTNIPWKEFIGLFYSRLDLDQDCDLEVFDENGVEIVSIDDLLDNDVLVVREKQIKDVPVAMAPPSMRLSSWQHQHARMGVPGMVRDTPPEPFRRSHDQAAIHPALVNHHHSEPGPPRMSSMSVPRISVKMPTEHAPSVMVGPPTLSHFIQCNSFGHYFLAEAENLKLPQVPGKSRKAHCVVKVPHGNVDDLRVLESEASLLRRISYHKSIISPPEVHIINFSEAKLQRFFYTVAPQKQVLLQPLFSSGGQKEAYVYPLYGITMATKLKSGLPPEKVLKYAYQLADIMHFLQQRGVIHQSLLPENIQVMSNDRVIVCNFETAIQTDPNTCLMVLSGGVPPPSNRYGLAPEVLSAFIRLRVESETVSYSSQYPWMFGVLSVLIATGQHPLGDYPAKYEESQKVRYRSHHIQALPDPEKYPQVFAKLVRRALSCDPVRRPTLQQILSVFKRDPRILSLMTGNRLPVQRTRRGSVPAAASQSTTHTQGHTPQGSMDGMDVDFQQRSGRSYDSRSATAPVGCYPPSYTTELYQTNHQSVRQPLTNAVPPNSKPLSVAPQSLHPSSLPPTQASAESLRMSRTHNSHPRDAHAQSEQITPHTSVPSRPADVGVSHNEVPPPDHPKEAWYTFNEASEHSTTRSELQTQRFAEARPNYENVFPLKRYGSVGAFSDDFVLDDEKNSHKWNVPSRLGQSGRVAGSIPHLPSVSSGSHERDSANALNRSAEILSPISANKEGERDQLNEFRYRRLLHSPSAMSSQEISPSFRRRGGDLEHLIEPSSPDTEGMGSTLDSGGKSETSSPQGHKLASSVEVRTTGVHGGENEQPVATIQSVLPATPYQTKPVVALKPNSTTGGEASSNTASSEAIPTSESASIMRPLSHDQTTSDSDHVGDGSEAQSVFSPEPPHDNQGGEVSDREFWTGILAVSSDTGKSGGEEDGRGGASSSDRDQLQSSASNAPVTSGDGEPEILLSISPAPPELLNVFPQALDSDNNLSGEMGLLSKLDNPASGTQATSASTLLLSSSASAPQPPSSASAPQPPSSASAPHPPSSASDPQPPSSASDPLTPSSVSDPLPPSSVSDPLPPSSASDPLTPSSAATDPPTITATFVPVQSSIVSVSDEAATGMNYGPMSPILEASQELSGSMSQLSNLSKTSPSHKDDQANSSFGLVPHAPVSSANALLQESHESSTQTQPAGIQSVIVSNQTEPSTSPRHVAAPQMSQLSDLSRFSRSPSPVLPLINKNIGLHASPRRQQNSPVMTPTRSLSPLATSSMTATPYQVTQGEATAVVNEQAAVEHPEAMAASSTQEQGRTHPNDENEQPSPSRRDSTGSKMRYSHQRQDSARSQNRIKQELDAMNTAISGMDSQVSQAMFTQGSSSGTGNTLGLTESQRGVATGPRHSQMHSQDPGRQQDLSRLRHSHSQASHHTAAVDQSARHNRGSGSATPKSSFASSARGHAMSSGRAPAIPSHNNFRPITPAMAAGSRPYSAPGVGEDGGRGLDHRSSTPHPRTGTPMNRGEVPQEGRHHQPHPQQQSSAQGRSRHPRGTRPAIPNVNGHQIESTHIQPPQVAPDSYDYLPPYSPPHSSSRNKPNLRQTAPQDSTATPTAGEGGSYPEPPPSYDEIFGELEALSSLPPRNQRDQNRHGRASRNGNSRQRRRRDRLHPSSSDSHPSSQTRSSALGRLSSITSIFRRSHSRPTQSEIEHPDIGIEDYTAEWVASYSHTPRPYSSQQATPTSERRRDGTHATSHNQDQHADHSQPMDGHTYHGGSGGTTSVPYVHPPPFPSEQSQQHRLAGNPMLAGQGNINRSLSGLPVTGIHTSPSGAQLRNTSGRDRSRPSSAYFLSDTRVFHLPSSPGPSTPRAQPSSAGPVSQMPTPPQHARLITNTGGNPTISASCTNIASDERPRPVEAANLRRQGSERISRQRRMAYLERINQGESTNHGSSSQRSPRRVGRRTANGQAGRDRPLGTSNGSSLRPDSATRNGQCMRSASDVSPINHRRIQQDVPSNFPEAVPEISVQKVTPHVAPSSDAESLQRAAASLQRAAASVVPVAITNQPAPDTTEVPREQSRPSSSVNVSLISISSLQGSNEEPTAMADRVENLRENAPPMSSAQSVSSPASDRNVLSHSSRSAARLRAEARRQSSLIATSSSEEDLLNELSQNTGSSSSHGRQRRRRSQGSGNFTGGSQRSQESNPVVCHFEVNEEEREETEAVSWPIPGNGRSGDNTDSDQQLRGSERDTEVMAGENLDQVRAEETSGHDSAPEHIIDITMEMGGSAPHLPQGKSCGHECERRGEAQCCVCGQREEEGPDSPPANLCALCARRSSSNQEVFIEPEPDTPQEVGMALSDNDQSSVGCLNLKVSSPHSSTPRLPQSPSSPSHRARSNKNCAVM